MRSQRSYTRIITDGQSVVLIFVIFEPSNERSPSRPFSWKIKPRIGFPREAVSYWPPAPFDTRAKDVSAPADQPWLFVNLSSEPRVMNRITSLCSATPSVRPTEADSTL